MTTNTMLTRSRLVELIGLSELARVTLVTAPAGYGKSTLVAQWADCTAHPVAWVPLSPDSNNPARFRAQLAAAIDAACPDCDALTQNDGALDEIAATLDVLVREGRQPVIVVDDLHVLENSEVHDAIDGLLVKLHEDVHVILISRATPPLPLARLRADGAVREVTAADLAFTLDETREVVERIVPQRLSAAQIATLEARTEGWIAGIRLALSSLGRVAADAVQSLIDTWPAARQLDDYIVEEVLATLPDDVREFVLRTVILPELSPDLCNAVLGIDVSARLIEEARRRLVFVRQLDANVDTLVYHALFAESAGRIADLKWPASDRLERHRRAALWYERAGRLEAAVDQAIAAEDWVLAEQCMRPLGKAMMDSGRVPSRLYWLSKLPEARVLADPHMARWYISALQYSGRMREAQRAFAVAGPMWEASGDPVQLGYAASARTMIAAMNGEIDQALALTYEALRHYPAEHAVDRMNAWTAVIQFEFQRGNDEAVEHAYRQAALCREALPAEQWWWTFQVELERANQLALRGNLEAARELCQMVLDRLPTMYRINEPRVRVLLAAIALERNDLDDAASQAAGVACGLEALPIQNWHSDALLVLARVYDAMGDIDRASIMLRRMRDLYTQHGGERSLHRLDALQATIWLREGRLGLANAWARHAHIVDQPWVRVFGDVDPRLSVARVELAAGQHDRAETRLRLLIERTKASRLWSEIVPLCMWHVVACVELDDDAAALASLRTALRHGIPGGFVRSFRTPGYDLRPFLDRVRHKLPADEACRADSVLGAAPADGPDLPAEAWPRPERRHAGRAIDTPLSSREQQVLRLLHGGCTNQEIAERLFITERTVKKHVGNILRKLDVANRTAAVLRALELELL